jgi:hypothetical protein
MGAWCMHKSFLAWHITWGEAFRTSRTVLFISHPFYFPGRNIGEMAHFLYNSSPKNASKKYCFCIASIKSCIKIFLSVSFGQKAYFSSIRGAQSKVAPDAFSLFRRSSCLTWVSAAFGKQQLWPSSRVAKISLGYNDTTLHSLYPPEPQSLLVFNLIYF